MSLSEAATRVTSPKAGGKCTVGIALAALPDAERAIALAWLDLTSKPRRKSSWIADVFEVEGIRVDGNLIRQGTIGRHRRRACDCP